MQREEKKHVELEAILIVTSQNEKYLLSIDINSLFDMVDAFCFSIHRISFALNGHNPYSGTMLDCGG